MSGNRPASLFEKAALAEIKDENTLKTEESLCFHNNIIKNIKE